MDTYTEAKLRLLNRLMGKGFEAEQVYEIGQSFDFIFADYDISSKSTALVAYDESIRKDINNYFLDMRIRGLAESTIDNQATFFRNFVDWLGNVPTTNVATNTIEKYLIEKEQNGVGANTINEYRGFLISFFTWTTKHKITAANVADDVQKRKAPKTLVTELKQSEIELVRQYANDAEHKMTRLYIEFLYSTGIRANELVNLRRCDITRSEENEDVWLVHVCHGKGDKERYALLDSAVKGMLDEYLATRHDKCQYLFVSSRGAHQITTAALRRRFDRLSKEIYDDIGIEVKMNPHKWRHTYATKLLRNGMDITCLQQTLGHSSVSTTQIYARQSLSNAVKDYAKYHPSYAAEPITPLDTLKAAVGDYMNS